MENEWLSTTKIILIVIILSVFGINIFYYLGRTTDVIVDTGKDVVGLAGEGIKKTVNVAERGTKSVVNIAAGATKSAIDVTGGVISSGIDELEQALHLQPIQTSPFPDKSNSSIQEPKRGGYCYIGTESGIRSCLYVGGQDECMSKQIYPSKSICINPKLRV